MPRLYKWLIVLGGAALGAIVAPWAVSHPGRNQTDPGALSFEFLAFVAALGALSGAVAGYQAVQRAGEGS